jgi:hypothetical protein
MEMVLKGEGIKSRVNHQQFREIHRLIFRVFCRQEMQNLHTVVQQKGPFVHVLTNANGNQVLDASLQILHLLSGESYTPAQNIFLYSIFFF